MGQSTLPDRIEDVTQLEALLSEPTDAAIRAMGTLEGDILLLGVAGKMGASLASMIVQASRIAGVERRVIGVSRFSDRTLRGNIERCGVETIQGDLLDDNFLESLPDVPNVIGMTGAKFGTTQGAWLTWATNVFLIGEICRRFRSSRLALFSTGNVYPLVPPGQPASRESDAMQPVGEYAMSAMGRERIAEYFCRKNETPVTLIRLNYAVEMRYGVLLDIAQQVLSDRSIDLSMSHVNVIWQGDANAMSIAALADADVPPHVINVAGPELLNVKEIALRFGDLFGKQVEFENEGEHASLLNDAAVGHSKYGTPRVCADQVVLWLADWLMRGGETLNKPTKFQVRDGSF